MYYENRPSTTYSTRLGEMVVESCGSKFVQTLYINKSDRQVTSIVHARA
jgi:hypothetical protein